MSRKFLEGFIAAVVLGLFVDTAGVPAIKSALEALLVVVVVVLIFLCGVVVGVRRRIAAEECES